MCHINEIQVLLSKALRTISNVPGFVQNDAIHRGFKVPTIKNYIRELSVSISSHLYKASGPQHYRLNGRPDGRRLQRGRPHDDLN